MSDSTENPYSAPAAGFDRPGARPPAHQDAAKSVAYEFTAEDFSRYNIFVHEKRGTGRGVRVALAIITLAFLVIFSLGAEYDLVTFISQLPFLLVMVLAVLFYPRYIRWVIKRSAQRLVAGGPNRFLFGKKRVTIAPEELTESGDFSDLHLRWQVVQAIDKNEDYVFIFLSNVHAIIVPRRAFYSAGEFADFYESARRFAGIEN